MQAILSVQKSLKKNPSEPSGSAKKNMVQKSQINQPRKVMNLDRIACGLILVRLGTRHKNIVNSLHKYT